MVRRPPMVEVTHVNRSTPMTRRRFLSVAGVATLGISPLLRQAGLFAAETRPNLLSAPLELAGDWKGTPINAVARVVTRIRQVDLGGVRLLSDRQPEKIHVENHASGSPAVWLHSDHPDVASIVVDIGPADWSKLAYQFGHELGHVLCNAWQPTSKPGPPCQWLEESMVEAFSIWGMSRLASSWERNPPFAGNSVFGASLRDYRAKLIKGYQGLANPASDTEILSWFRSSRAELDRNHSVGTGPFIVRLVTEMEHDIACVEDLGAVNRWPGGSGVRLEDYLKLWEKSCTEIHTRGHLPALIRKLLGVV
jgi:hypothetical protein